MKKVYKVSLTINGLLLFLCILIGISYLYFIKVINVDKSVVLVTDGLSINYLDGDAIKTNGDDKTYNFSVTNNSNETLYYYIYLDNIVCSKCDLKYSLIENSNNVNISNKDVPDTSTYLSSYIEIEPNITHSFNMEIFESKHSSLSATLSIGLEENQEEEFATVLISHSEINKEAATNVGEQASTTNEGLIESSDDLGLAYYYRGNVSNNYVSFAGKLWRIVKINGDSSIKLILDDYIVSNANYYNASSTNPISSKIDFSISNIQSTLDAWYKNNLANYDKYITTYKFCVDDAVSHKDNDITYYLGYSRLQTDYNQSFSCLGTNYSSKIGLITADEAVYAGATKNSDNTSFYLYNPSKEFSWWTMTPAFSNTNDVVFYEININGMLKMDSLGSYYRGIKPVINLTHKIYVTGTGTHDDPYVIKE